MVIEDDYDGEFRYDRQPVGALQALAPEHVVYIGCASKSLAPGVRLGRLVLPGHLVDDVAVVRKPADDGYGGRGIPGRKAADSRHVIHRVSTVDAIGRGDAEWRLSWGRDPLPTGLTGTALVTPTR